MIPERLILIRDSCSGDHAPITRALVLEQGECLRRERTSYSGADLPHWRARCRKLRQIAPVLPGNCEPHRQGSDVCVFVSWSWSAYLSYLHEKSFLIVMNSIENSVSSFTEESWHGAKSLSVCVDFSSTRVARLGTMPVLLRRHENTVFK